MEKFSILIPSYREKERLYNLVQTILQDNLRSQVEKIVVVTPDKNPRLPKHKKIFLIREKSRRGKYYAIRLGLKLIKTKIVVMISSDLNMRKNFLQYLLSHFKDTKVGLVVGKPIADKNSRIYAFSQIIWELHHLLCLREPKGTEICAFRKIFDYFPKISADEVFIEYKIKKAGFSIIYEPRAYGYTRIPNSLVQFLEQRKRCFIGHLFIWKKYGFTTSSAKLENLLYLFMQYVKHIKDMSELLKFLIIVQLELIARIDASLEFLLFKNKEIVWKRSV